MDRYLAAGEFESITAFNFLVCWISLYFILKSSRVILLQNLHLFMLIWPTFLYCIASSSGQRRHWLDCRLHYFLIYAACYLTNDVNIKAWWFLRPPDKPSLVQPPGRGPDICPDMRCCWLLLSELVLCSAPSVPQTVFTITEKAPTRAFSWLKAPTSDFTFKIL